MSIPSGGGLLTSRDFGIKDYGNKKPTGISLDIWYDFTLGVNVRMGGRHFTVCYIALRKPIVNKKNDKVL